jgi:hypothetical protein
LTSPEPSSKPIELLRQLIDEDPDMNEETLRARFRERVAGDGEMIAATIKFVLNDLRAKGLIGEAPTDEEFKEALRNARTQ